MFLRCPFPSEKREREKNRHKRKRGKWPLYLSPDQNKNRWTTFPDALDSTGFRYSICRPAVCVQAIANCRPVIALLIRLHVWFRKENIWIVK